MNRMIFVNFPVQDLSASIAFYTALGIHKIWEPFWMYPAAIPQS